MSPTRSPKLRIVVLNDDEKLAQAIESHIRNYCPYIRQQRRILQLQSALKNLIDVEAWAVYLKLEDAVNYRDNRIREGLVRWAFRAGARSRTYEKPKRR